MLTLAILLFIAAVAIFFIGVSLIADYAMGEGVLTLAVSVALFILFFVLTS